MEKRFSAGEGEEEGSGGLHLLCEVEPFGRGAKMAGGLGLLYLSGGKTNIAHPAVEVTQGCQFEGAANGAAVEGGAVDEHLFN